MSSSTEPTVTTRGLPPDYSFVPKGNVYITANCRKTTQEDGETVYVIVAPGGNDKKTLGIAVPRNIHDDVRAREAETRAQRAAVVDKRDTSIQTEFEKAIRQEYPGIPDDSLAKVLQTALQKRSGKVGQTGTLDIQLKARLAVRAHIRHCHTLYDTHLRAGRMNQNEARAAIKDEVDALAAAWGKAPGARSHAKTPSESGQDRPKSSQQEGRRKKIGGCDQDNTHQVNNSQDFGPAATAKDDQLHRGEQALRSSCCFFGYGQVDSQDPEDCKEKNRTQAAARSHDASTTDETCYEIYAVHFGIHSRSRSASP